MRDIKLPIVTYSCCSNHDVLFKFRNGNARLDIAFNEETTLSPYNLFLIVGKCSIHNDQMTKEHPTLPQKSYSWKPFVRLCFYGYGAASYLHRESVLRYVVVDHDTMYTDLINVDVEGELVYPRPSGLPGRVRHVNSPRPLPSHWMVKRWQRMGPLG